MDDAVLEELRQRLATTQPRHLGAAFRPGQRVRVEGGALAMMDGVFDRCLEAPDRVRILVQLLGRQIPVDVNATILSALFVFLPLLLMAFAVTQANRWSADEEDGRLELVLSTPQPRLRVLLGRFAALTTATVIIGVLTLAVTALASAATGLKLDGGNLAAATLGMIPLGLLLAAIGYLLSGWLRTAVDTGLLSFLLVIWFFISFIGPELNWSDAALRLSAFYYYGTPLLHGLPLLDMLGVLAVSIVALVLASVRFVRKDIGR